MPDNVSDNEKPLDRGSIMEGAEFLAACYALKELVEDRRGYRWASQNGIRLKDTAEWAAFYVAVNKKQSGQSSPAAPVDGLVAEYIAARNEYYRKYIARQNRKSLTAAPNQAGES